MRNSSSWKTRKGFTLIELLTVIAIGGVLASLSVATLFSSNSAKFSNSIVLFSDYLTQAQTSAKASNSYVWVGIGPSTTDPSSVNVIALQGTTGLEGDLASGQTRPLAKPLQLHGVALNDAVPGKSPDTNAVSSIQAKELGSINYSVGGVNQTFTKIIGITPTGQTFLVLNTLPHWIQIGLAPYNDPKLKNFGVLYIAGLTGHVIIYRP